MARTHGGRDSWRLRGLLWASRGRQPGLRASSICWLADEEGQILPRMVRRGKHHSIQVPPGNDHHGVLVRDPAAAIAHLVAADPDTFRDMIRAFNRDGVAGQERVSLGAQEGGPTAGAPIGCGIDALGLEDLPHSRGGNLETQSGEFAVDAAIAPGRVLLARRNTRARMERRVRGRPGRLFRETVAWRRLSRSRCQRRTVSGRTSRCSRRSAWRGNWARSAARKVRSAGVNLTFRSPSWRSRTVIGWRSARISASLSRDRLQTEDGERRTDS